MVAILLLLLLAVAFSAVFKKNMGETLPLSCMSMIFIAYVMSLLNMLQYSFVMITVLLILSTIAGFRQIKTYNFAELRKQAASPSIFLFLGFLILLYYLNVNTYVFQWDEYSHWATTVKEMFYTNRLSIQEGSTTLFKSYPPAMALWQYLFISTSSVWEDWKIIYAYNIFLVIYMLPATKKLTWKKAIFLLMITAVMYVLPYLYESPWEGVAWHCINIDRSISFLFAYILYSYFSNAIESNISNEDTRKDRIFKVINMALAMGILSLLKSIGIFFVLFAAVCIFIDAIIQRKKVKRNLLHLGLCVLFAFLIYKTWTIKLAIVDVAQTWNHGEINVGQIFNLLRGAEEPWRYDVVKAFAKNIWKSGIQFNASPIQISIMAFPMVWLIGLLYVSHKHSESVNLRKRMIALSLMLLILFCIFEIFVLFTELYLFSMKEALKLSSYARYSSNYILGISVFVVLLIFNVLFGDNPRKNLIECAVLTLLLVFSIPFYNAAYDIFKHDEYMDKVYQGTEFADYIDCVGHEGEIDQILTHNDKVYILTLDDQFGLHFWRKILIPAKTSGAYEQVSLGAMFDTWDQNIKDKGFTYVFVNSTRNDFNHKYSHLFDDNTVLEKNLYRVETENGLHFTKVELSLGATE